MEAVKTIVTLISDIATLLWLALRPQGTRLANKKRKGYGKLSTHWPTGGSGKTSSASRAALSALAPASPYLPAPLAVIGHTPCPTDGTEAAALAAEGTRCSA